jgi:hypothetical protein
MIAAAGSAVHAFFPRALFTVRWVLLTFHVILGKASTWVPMSGSSATVISQHRALPHATLPQLLPNMLVDPPAVCKILEDGCSSIFPLPC